MDPKWKSRKFWLAIIAQVTGIVTLAVGAAQAEQFSVIAGSVITILSALGYLKVEADIDKANVNNPNNPRNQVRKVN